MDIKLYINNDKLTCRNFFSINTGNVETYRCVFDIKTTLPGLTWFCVFKQGENVHRRAIKDNSCSVPEITDSNEPLFIGCYATNSDETDFKRLSTNWLNANLKSGAYSEATAPETPSPDVWETLVSKSVPIIGENGNWYLYDFSSGEYKDSGVSAQGTGGGGGASITVDDKISSTSTNPVQNKVVKEQIDILDNRISSATHGASSAFNIANEAKTIALGRATGYVFDTEADMRAWLNVPENINNLVLGDNLYIRDVNVPDYWWDGTKAQQLETQLVDLTEYATKEEVDDLIGDIETLLGGI